MYMNSMCLCRKIMHTQIKRFPYKFGKVQYNSYNMTSPIYLILQYWLFQSENLTLFYFFYMDCIGFFIL